MTRTEGVVFGFSILFTIVVVNNSLAGLPLPNGSRLYPIKQCLYQETNQTRLHRFQ